MNDGFDRAMQSVCEDHDNSIARGNSLVTVAQPQVIDAYQIGDNEDFDGAKNDNQ